MTVLVLSGLLFAARNHLHFVREGWRELGDANRAALAAALGAVLLSMVAQAEVMVVLMRGAGVPVRRFNANALGLAANAWSASFPGGPAISAALIFREQRRWGATTVIAGWYMAFSGVLAAAGMAVLAIGSVFFLGLRVKPSTLAMSLVGLVLMAWGIRWLARHPGTVERFLLRVLRRVNRWRKKPADHGAHFITDLSGELNAVDLPISKISLAMFWSLMNWVLEIICLWFCINAIGGQAPVAGVILSFLTAKLIGQVQVTPGGLGPVDVALTSTLVAIATLPSVQAVAAVIVFRMLSFVLLVAIGWLVYLASRLTPGVLRPHAEEAADADLSDGGAAPSATDAAVAAAAARDAAEAGAASASQVDGGADSAAGNAAGNMAGNMVGNVAGSVAGNVAGSVAEPEIAATLSTDTAGTSAATAAAFSSASQDSTPAAHAAHRTTQRGRVAEEVAVSDAVVFEEFQRHAYLMRLYREVRGPWQRRGPLGQGPTPKAGGFGSVPPRRVDAPPPRRRGRRVE